MKTEEFKCNGEKHFDLMHDKIGKVKENSPLDVRIYEQKLGSKYCYFFVNKINNIWDMLMDYSSFVLEKEREPGMIEFNEVSDPYVEKIIE